MRIDSTQVEQMAAEVGSKDELARMSDLNPQTLYRLKSGKALSPKSSRKMLAAMEKHRASRTKATG